MGTRVVMLLSGSSVYFDLFSVNLTTVDVSSFPFIIATALNRKTNHDLESAWGSMPFHLKKKKTH